MTQISESGLSFSFLDNVDVKKFDDTKFYRSYYNNLPNCKGVDIIANSDKILQIIEVKNCIGYETENVWRTSVNNSKLSSAPAGLNVDERDSLDIEVSKKVASTISCLFGAWTKSSQVDVAEEVSPLRPCPCIICAKTLYKRCGSDKVMRSNAINFEIIAEKPFLLANYQKRLEAVDIQDGPANQVRLPFRV